MKNHFGLNSLSPHFQRILVVDDNVESLQLLSHILERADFEVWCASSGMQALKLIQRRGLPHLAIVDVNMPVMNGFELCGHIREMSDLPIIILTVSRDENTTVQALEQFADDYIRKPFHPNELVGRVQRVLRRVDNFDYTQKPPVQVDEHLLVDFVGSKAFVDGEPIALTPIEARLLYILVHNAGRFVSSNSLMRHLWPLESADKGRLYAHMARLRHKLQTGSNQPDYILSKQGTGYTFRAAGG